MSTADELFEEVAAVVAKCRGPHGRDWLRALPCGKALDAIDTGPNARARYHRNQAEHEEAYYREKRRAEVIAKMNAQDTCDLIPRPRPDNGASE